MDDGIHLMGNEQWSWVGRTEVFFFRWNRSWSVIVSSPYEYRGRAFWCSMLGSMAPGTPGKIEMGRGFRHPRSEESPMHHRVFISATRPADLPPLASFHAYTHGNWDGNLGNWKALHTLAFQCIKRGLWHGRRTDVRLDSRGGLQGVTAAAVPHVGRHRSCDVAVPCCVLLYLYIMVIARCVRSRLARHWGHKHRAQGREGTAFSTPSTPSSRPPFQRDYSGHHSEGGMSLSDGGGARAPGPGTTPRGVVPRSYHPCGLSSWGWLACLHRATVTDAVQLTGRRGGERLPGGGEMRAVAV